MSDKIDPNLYKQGQKIRNFRLRAKMSQLDLETRIGASPGSISRIENGIINPTKETIGKIIDELSLSVIDASYLYNLDIEEILDSILIDSHMDLDKVLDSIVKQLVEKLNYKYPSLYLLNNKKTFSIKKLNIPKLFTELATKLIHKSIYKVEFKLENENLLSLAINTKKIYQTNNLFELLKPYINKNAAEILQKALNVHLILVIPIYFENESLGCLALATSNNYVSEQELKIIRILTRQIGFAIHNAKKYAELEKKIKEVQYGR